jgi:hypothetical protein
VQLFSEPEVVNKMKTALVVLGLLGELFAWSWVAASIVTLWSLYQAIANDGSWLHMLWSATAASTAMAIAFVLSGNKRRLDYVYQLQQRGYPKSEADLAWRSANDGGFNVLLSLQQAEAQFHSTRADFATESSAADRSRTP